MTGWTYPLEAARLIVGFSRVGIFLPWQKPSDLPPGVEKYVDNFWSGLRVNIFQNPQENHPKGLFYG